MRSRIKRILSFVLSFVLFISIFSTDNYMFVHAEDTTKTVTVTNLPEIEDWQEYDVNFTGLNLTVYETNGDSIIEYKTEVPITDITNNKLAIPYNTESTYTYKLTSENYKINPETGSLDLSSEQGTTIQVESITPDYNLSEISGINSITVGDGVHEYSVGFDKPAWENDVTWSLNLENADGSDVDLITETNNKCKIQVNSLNSNSDISTVTLKATDSHGREVSKNISISKKSVDLQIFASGTWQSFSVTVTAPDDLNGEEIKLKKGTDELTQRIVDGKAIFNFENASCQLYDIEASYEGNNKYKSASTHISFKPNQVDQTLILDKITENINNVTYGDKDVAVAKVSGSGNEDAEYIVSVADEMGNASINDEGELIFTPKKVGNATITVIKKGDNNYSEATDEITVDVKKKPVSISKGTIKAEEKVYDGNTTVTVTAKVTEGLVENEDISDEEPLKHIDLRVENAIAEKADAGETLVTCATFEMPEEWSDKYVLVEDDAKITKEDNIKVKINPATLHVKIGELSIEWYHIYNANYKEYVESIANGTDNLISYDGFIPGEDSSNLDGFMNPTIVCNTITPSEENKYTDALWIEAETGNATKNYKFDFSDNCEECKKGTIKLVDDSRNANSYLDLSNDSKNISQIEPGKYYYGEDAKIKFSINNSNDPDGYTKIVDENGNNILADGIDFSGRTEKVTVNIKLQNADNHGNNNWTEITFLPDHKDPNIDISIDTVQTKVSEFIDAITFNHYSQSVNDIQVSISVNDWKIDTKEDEAGIKSWGYIVIDTDEDKVFGSNNITEDDVISMFYGEESAYQFTEVEQGTLSKNIIVGKTDGKTPPANYIVFVSATDKVGNHIICSSNGIVIEDIKLNEIVLSYDVGDGTELFVEDDVTYFNSDVKIKAEVADDTDNYYSGVKSISCSPDINGELGITKENIFGQRPDMTLESLKGLNGSCIFEFENDIEESQKITASFTALDWAGNSAINDGVSKTFVIDSIKPKLQNLDIQRASDDSGSDKYYGKDVSVQFEIKERYLKDVTLAITMDGERIDDISLNALQSDVILKEMYGIEAITLSYKEQNQDNDDFVTIVNILFSAKADHTNDHEFKVEVVGAADKSNNQVEFDAGNTADFVIDTTAPVADFIYYKDSTIFEPGVAKDAPSYVNRDFVNGFTVELVVEEKYFEVNYDDNDDDKKLFLIYSAWDSENKEIDKSENQESEWEIDDDSNKNRKKLVVTTDGNYSFAFEYTDPAGNSCKIPFEYVTLDRNYANAEIIVKGLVNDSTEKKWLNYFLDGITFRFFGNSSATATVSSDDDISGVASSQYYESETLLTKADIQNQTIEWQSYSEKEVIPLVANKNIIVYQRVEDRAGNVEYYSSDSFVLDNKEPAPEIAITPTVPAWKKGVYSASDNPGFVVTVTDPINNNAFSGLKEVTYTIKDEDSSVSGVILSTEQSRGKHLQELPGGSATIYINPNEFYSNNVKVTVTASDWSANSPEPVSTELKIDNKAPEVEFSFDTSDVQNGKYYKNNKTLYITVNERNFDPSYTPQVTSSTGGGYSFSGWSTVGETTTGSITFSGDGDYSVTYDCYDLAGNKSNTKTQEEFTVDKTTPVINVSYDNNSAQNGNYYKAARTATITINEHNFNASDVQVATTASNGSAPRVSGWSNSGDRHTATVYFGSDADYTFDISYTDMAGNNAADYSQDSFTVDLTNPVVEITGVANKSANKGTVAPTITLNDTNFIGDGVTLTLTGANKGKIDISSMVTRTSTETGQSITFRNFGDNMDDIYTLTAKSVDKAGNETSRTITFSVNRHGSTYELNDETEKLVNKGYTNSPVDVVIEEYNVDSLEFIELSYSKDGEIVKLTRNKDYTVKEEGSDGQWKKYTYTIYAKCFEEEGEYNINISSVDRAQNESNNKVQSMNVAFVVDKTAPTMAISNLENRGRYTANIHQFTLNVKDNTRLSKVELYLDGKLVHTYEGDELIVEDGKIYIDIDSKGEYQTVKLIAYDEAGNPTEPAEYDVLVTSNRWVQFVANKPLFYGAIVALAAAAGFIFFLIFWKKKKKEGQK